MKVLVTGVLGLTGEAVAKAFMAKGWEVVGLDNNMRSHFFKTEKRSAEGVLDIDIRNMVEVEDLFQAQTFDAVVHTAAQPSHDYAADHVIEDFSVNALGTLNLLECTRHYSPKAVFIHLSTDKVYGENMEAKLYEDDMRYEPLRGSYPNGFNESLGLDFAGQRSLFGCSKAAADMYVQEYGNYFGMQTVCFRPGCITGRSHAGAEQHGFLAYLAKCIRDGKPYKIFGYKGKQVRDQIHADDVASACLMVAENPKPGAQVYNLGGGPTRSLSILEAGEILSKQLGKPFKYEIHPQRKGDRQWDVHDVSKFRKDYPEWDYKYDLAAIIEDFV